MLLSPFAQYLLVSTAIGRRIDAGPRPTSGDIISGKMESCNRYFFSGSFLQGRPFGSLSGSRGVQVAMQVAMRGKTGGEHRRQI
jgi:hypothetical protein